ncbi:MAG: nucleoside 2-deoxyribosyltransferase [Acidobacteriota bacterium]|nr:nucleoside 2-deoxyribosyltransferase [Acidobacteriota bacterium]
MPFFHVLALRGRNKTKLINNRSEAQVLSDYVIPYLQTGTIQTSWGGKIQTVPVADLEVYRTQDRYDKKRGIPFDKFKRKKRNLFPALSAKAQRALSQKKTRVFVIMPIQGEEAGTQEEQRVFTEYEARFDAINSVLNDLGCFGIRIDKEYPLDELVRRIKDEIERAQFLVADLTDERPSCYFEAGFAEGHGKPVIYVASENSVMDPKKETKIHFDIHRNVQFFRNRAQLATKIRAVFEKNRDVLLGDQPRLDEKVVP